MRSTKASSDEIVLRMNFLSGEKMKKLLLRPSENLANWSFVILPRNCVTFIDSCQITYESVRCVRLHAYVRTWGYLPYKTPLTQSSIHECGRTQGASSPRIERLVLALLLPHRLPVYKQTLEVEIE